MIKRNELAFVITFALAIGVSFGCVVTSKYAHRSAIEQSCAHYDARTGEFKWGLPQ
jgi:hypothetical protein